VPDGAFTPSDQVIVTYGAQRTVISPGEVFSFGRAHTCTVRFGADDQGISRLAGSVERDGGTWWLLNRSGSRPLTVTDDLGLRTVVAPGHRLSVVGLVTVVVEGETRRHAITIEARPPDADMAVPDGADRRPTATAEGVWLDDDDRRALAAVFAGYLRAFPRYDPHPRSYADAAAELGWPRTTLLKRMERIRRRLTDAGVTNLLGDTALEHLADWALATRTISRDDLETLGRS
jgi:hypothetical protein